MTLRIALIASSRFAIRQPFAGGLEAHVWHLARALANRGHEVAVFAAPGTDPDAGCRTLTVRPLLISPTARADTSMAPESFMADHHAYLTLMLELAGSREFDIIHNHSLHYLPIAMAPMLFTPMLTTVHTPPTPWLESAIDASGGVGTRFAAVSQHTARAWRGTAGPLTVIPNGIDADRWPLGPGGGPLVWSGRITAEKAPHLAIEAARLSGRPLVLAGPVYDQRYYDAEVAPRLGDGVDYAGHLDQAQLAELVGRASAALVTPVWDEPYGLVVAEAMCCGTPVVAFERGGIPELVAPQAGRLVPPGDVAAMAEAVTDAVALPRDGVREHGARNCSSQAMLTAYLALYDRAITEYRKGSHDRLLHPSSGLWPSGPSQEHLRSAAAADYSVELAGHRPRTSIRCSCQATA